MRTRIIVLAVGLSLALAAPARAQGQTAKSPADVLPAKVLAYVEIQKPGQAAKEVRDLFKGSVLYNVPDSMAELEAKHPDVPFYMTSGYKALGLLIAPEVVKEAAKGQGAAVAILSVRAAKAGNEEKEEKGGKGRRKMAAGPEVEFVVIVQPGSSNFPAYLTRFMLASAPMKMKETVAGVKIYRVYNIDYRFEPDKDGKGKETIHMRESDPSFAMMKDYIFIGSHKAVKDCVLRAKGKAEGESLAQSKDFQAIHKKLAGEPGLFAYGSMTALLDFTKEMAKNSSPGLEAFMEGYEKLVNPRAFHGMGISLSLQKGTLYAQRYAALDPNEKSPLLDLYPTKPVSTEILHFAPKHAIMTVVMSNAEGGKRWNKLLEMADELVSPLALGGRKVSDVIHEAEKKLGKDIGKEVVGKITTVGFSMGNPMFAPEVITRIDHPDYSEERFETEVPMFLLLETTDEHAAQTVMELLGKLAALAHKDAKAASKTIKDQTVAVIKLHDHQHLAYGTVGKVVVIGRSAEAVAHALADGTAKKGLASDPKVMAALKDTKTALAVSLIKPASLAVTPFLVVSGRSTMKSDKGFKEDKFDKKDFDKSDKKDFKDKGDKDTGGDKGKDGPPKVKITRTVRKDSPEDAKRKKALMKIMAEEPWLIKTLTRSKDAIAEVGKSPGWDKFVPKLVNFGAEQMMESYESRRKKDFDKSDKFDKSEDKFNDKDKDKDKKEPSDKKDGELEQALLRSVPPAREQQLLTLPAPGSRQVSKY